MIEYGFVIEQSQKHLSHVFYHLDSQDSWCPSKAFFLKKIKNLRNFYDCDFIIIIIFWRSMFMIFNIIDLINMILLIKCTFLLRSKEFQLF